MPKPTRCPRCSHENEPSFAFCLGCGEPLRARPAPGAATCAACGAALGPGFRFCGRCGRPAEPTAPAPPPLPRAPAFRVTTILGDGEVGRSFAIEGELLCGRTEGALRLADDPTVSPRHARFTRSAETLRVEDLGSLNGTFVRLRAPVALAAGEEFRVGRELLRLEPVAPRAGGAAEPGPAAWRTRAPGFRFRVAQLLDDGGVGERFPLREGENLVGREAGQVTFPDDRYVSGRHARLEVRGDVVTLSDAGSSNGTFARVAGAAQLAPGDQLLVGRQLLRIDG